MSIQTVSIIGMGALGVLFGQKMAQHMPKSAIRFIASPERIARYQKEGVYCNGEACDFRYIAPNEAVEPADLLIFAVKYTALPQAIEEARSQVGEKTAILSLLNGIQSEEDLTEAYGEKKVLYCVAQGMDAVKVGNRLTYSHAGKLCFGEKDSQKTERVHAIAGFFDSVGIDYVIPMDMKKALWNKFMLNTGLNQVSAIMHTGYGGIQREGAAREKTLAAMREVMAIAQKKGIALDERDIAVWMDLVATFDPEGKPSMQQDFDAKRPSEVELFSGTAIRLGREVGIPTPVNEDIYREVQAIEASYPR